MDEVSFRKLLYRFLTGLHLDGIKREAHERNTWWTALGRHHRVMWRLGTIGVAVGWTWLILHYRMWTIEGTGMVLPFLLDKLWRAVHKRSGPRRVHRINVSDVEEPAPFADHHYTDDTRKLLTGTHRGVEDYDLSDEVVFGPIDIKE